MDKYASAIQNVFNGDTVDSDVIRESAALLVAMREHIEQTQRDYPYGYTWTRELYQLSYGTCDMWPGRPDVQEPHVRLLVELKIADIIPVDDGMRIRLLRDDLADMFDREYSRRLKSATTEIAVRKDP